MGYEGGREQGEKGYEVIDEIKNGIVSYMERYVRFVLETSNDISYFTLE